MSFRPHASRRSDIQPFIVMDVMRAAADREQTGERVIHMEVGQPGARAPETVLEAAKAAVADGHFRYTEALGSEGAPLPHRPPLCGSIRPRRSGRAHRGDHRLLGRLQPCLSRRLRRRRAGGDRRARLPGLQEPHPRARPDGGRDRDRRFHPSRADAGNAGARPRRGAAGRRSGRQPGQSERHHDDARRARRAHRLRRTTSASSSSPTRSITGWFMRARRPPRFSIRKTPSSSIPSRNTIA